MVPLVAAVPEAPAAAAADPVDAAMDEAADAAMVLPETAAPVVVAPLEDAVIKNHPDCARIPLLFTSVATRLTV